MWENRNSFTRTMTRTRRNVSFAWFLPKLGLLVIIGCILYYFSLELSNPTTDGDHLNSIGVGPGDYVRTLNQNVKTPHFDLVTPRPRNQNVEIHDSKSDLVNSDSISNSEICQYRGLSVEKVFSGNLRVPQDDSKLLGFVRKCVFTPPSPLPYNLTDPTGDPSAVQGVREYVMSLLGNKRNGVFMEFGANDGEDISNTLVLERDFGWYGLLIEADPLMAKKLLGKHRKAWVTDVCIGIHPYPYEITMYRHKDWTLTSRLAEGGFDMYGPDWSNFTVKCLPLYTMMSALGLKDLDYMSMDIEGVELKVLNTLPFDKINVKVFSIETMPGSWDAVREFMDSKGYAFVKTIRGKYVEDDVFAHRSILKGTSGSSTQEVLSSANPKITVYSKYLLISYIIKLIYLYNVR